MSFDDRRAARIPGEGAELRIEIPRKDAGIAPDAVMGEGRDRPGVRAIELDESRDAFPLQVRLIRHLVDDRVAGTRERFGAEADRAADAVFGAPVPDPAESAPPGFFAEFVKARDHADGFEHVRGNGVKRARN